VLKLASQSKPLLNIQFPDTQTVPCTGPLFRALAGPRVHGAHTRFLHTTDGNWILAQSWTVETFRVCYLAAKLNGKETFSFRVPLESELICISLGGKFRLLEHEAGDIRVKSRHGLTVSQQQFQGFVTIYPLKEITKLFLLCKIPETKKHTVIFGIDPVIEKQIQRILSVSYAVKGAIQSEVLAELSTMISRKTTLPGNRHTIDTEEHEQILAFKKYLDAQAGKTTGISAWCRKTGITERKLSEGFHAIVGKTVRDYYQSHKLEKARDAIMDTRKPLKQIARDAGYSGYTNLASAFKKHFGITPRNFRKSKQANTQ
jgi:AraC-like DNA-binding protein